MAETCSAPPTDPALSNSEADAIYSALQYSALLTSCLPDLDPDLDPDLYLIWTLGTWVH